MSDKRKKQYPKPTKIGEIPMAIIEGELWGLEVSFLSAEEEADLKKESDKDSQKGEVTE